ncbi:MAG: hypothetical protein ABIQ95_12615, partial [Bdellovibrionia bacterium]
MKNLLKRSLQILILSQLSFSNFLYADIHNPSIFLPYGFLKVSAVGASQSLDSFGNSNMSAPTTAHPPTTVTNSQFRSSLQVEQSRLGVWINPADPIRGQFEIDFVDFKLASPTTGSHPRLRIAKIVFKPDENNELILGQDWDVFSPNKPITYNIVGLNFQAGNIGFMRQQAQWRISGNSYHFVFALGLAGRNESASDGDLELGNLPLFTSSYSFQIDSKLEIGIAGTAGKLNFNETPTGVYGINSFLTFKIPGQIEVRGEAYYGQNLGNANFLGLAIASSKEILHEFGGYLSFKG